MNEPVDKKVNDFADKVSTEIINNFSVRDINVIFEIVRKNLIAHRVSFLKEMESEIEQRKAAYEEAAVSLSNVLAVNVDVKR